jgi:hypothetical protein
VLGAALCAAASIRAVSLARADTAELVSGQKVTGIVRGLADGKLIVFKSAGEGGKASEARHIAITDLVRMTFEPTIDRVKKHASLVNNDHAGTGRSLSGMIKLRAGFHRIVLPYWHGDGRSLLRLQYSVRSGSRPRGLRIVPPSMLFHMPLKGTETLSAGVDKAGYRLPETVSGVEPQLSYTLRRLAGGRKFAAIEDFLRESTVINSGTLERIGTKALSDDQENIAMLLSGYFQAPEDGDYTFLLSSDGGSQLYLGATPSSLLKFEGSNAKPPWSVHLIKGGRLDGTLESWKDSKLRVGVSVGQASVPLTVPLAEVAELWSNRPLGKEARIDRLQLPAKDDAVYARTNSGRIQRVSGLVQAIDGETLTLQFGGQDRKISLQKIAGILLAPDRRASAADVGFHQVIETSAGLKLPGHLVTIAADGTAKFRTLWGDDLLLSMNELTALTVRDGKAVSLTELTPNRVEQVPFFDRLIAYRTNESLSGGPMTLRDGPCRRGISVHAKTVLAYALGKKFQRFRAKIGFQLPEGMLGDAQVRILGDGRVLFENASLKGSEPIAVIDVDIMGVETLTLSVDFGRQEDVGDRVVWGEPILIRSAIGESKPANQKTAAK